MLRSAVGFDAYAWLLTDPETAVGAGPLADVPCLDELPRLIRLRYLTDLNRWTGLGETVAASLHHATGGELARSLVWRDLLSSYDVGDVASVVFADRYSCWGFLELWRSAPFTAAEIGLLIDFAMPITSALRASQAATFASPTSSDAARLGPVVLMLSPDLEVLAETPLTETYLRVLVPPAPDRDPVPSSAYNVGAQLLAREAGVDDHGPWARLYLSHGLWLTLRAARIGRSGPATDRNIAVTIEQSSPNERVDLFARAFAFTARETELLGHLVTGADSREVARLMYLSQHTVQDHLKSIFTKTGVRNRRTLLSRALGA